MADREALREALRDAAHEAVRLSCIAGGLDALREAMPASVHPDAGPIEQRATDALGELILVVIERTEALAERLERIHTAAGKAE